MSKVDPMVLKETKYIACWVLILSVLLQAVFLVIGAWDYTVLLGNLLSGSVCVLNFFLMGTTVQKALQKDKDGAKTTIKASQLYRMLMLTVTVVLGATLPCFQLWATVIPLFFSRIAVSFRPLFDKKQ
ncbi:MAG: hypothetical protein E7403_02880 [Ruminococcaceae bacterium]|nr:hypothetical protein [Oscillospiraceae bacterium]